MNKRKNCPACLCLSEQPNSKAIIAPWIRELARVKARSSKYFICGECGTGWVDVNYTALNMNLLYADYRGPKYLRTRRKWEKTYSESFNASIDSGHTHMDLRRAQMEKLILKNSPSFLSTAKSVLDIGGGHGSLIPNWPGLNSKYVLDVSGVETLAGIRSIKSWSEIPVEEVLSLVMACGILEHLTSPSEFIESITCEIQNSELMDSNSLFYFEVPAGVPSRKKQYLKFIFAWLFSHQTLVWNFYDRIQLKFGRASFPLRIAEHIQFFTPKGIEKLITLAGLEYLGSITYSAKESLEDSESVRFGEILGVVARLPSNIS